MENAQEFVNLLMDKVKQFPHLRNRSDEVSGLFKGEAGILMWLYHNIYFHGEEDTTPSSLSDMIGFSRPATTTLLNSLERKEYIIRRMSRHDRRRQQVLLTDKGRAFAEAKLELMGKRLQYLFEQLGTEKTEQFLDLIQESLEILSRYDGDETDKHPGSTEKSTQNR